MSEKIYFVTSNPGKFSEVTRYLGRHVPSIELVQAIVELPELQSIDQRAIAVDKARSAWQHIQAPLLVDDSGVYFEHCNEFPGTITKQVFMGIGYEGIFALTQHHNRAYFRLNLVYMSGPETFHVFEGLCRGIIKRPLHFHHEPGFPWDAIFFPEGSPLSYADLHGTPQEEQFLYRMRALATFAQWYNTHTTTVLSHHE